MRRSDRRPAMIIFLAWLAYMISYLGRADYGACLLEIVSETGSSRAAAGMASSVFSICNAFGQIASGFILRKIKPVKLIFIELVFVSLINAAFPFSGGFALMAALWGMNGCLQSTLLCSATRIFTDTLEEPYLSRGAVLMNTVGAAGGMLNYLISWTIIKNVGWRYVFINSASLLALTAVVWYLAMPKLAGNSSASDKPQAGTVKDGTKTPILKQLCLYGTAFVVAGAFFVGLLRESVSLWIPTFMNEIFGISSASSVIITVFVPCLQICGALLGGRLGRRFKNLHKLSSGAFAVSGIHLLTLFLTLGASPAVSILLFTVNAISMTAALTFLLSLFPIRYFSRGAAPVLVGIINFFVHSGDFVASFGIGMLSEKGGWSFTLIVLALTAFTAAAVMLAGSGTADNEKTHPSI